MPRNARTPSALFVPSTAPASVFTCAKAGSATRSSATTAVVSLVVRLVILHSPLLTSHSTSHFPLRTLHFSSGSSFRRRRRGPERLAGHRLHAAAEPAEPLGHG